MIEDLTEYEEFGTLQQCIDFIESFADSGGLETPVTAQASKSQVDTPVEESNE
jgi:hypothetical protein